MSDDLKAVAPGLHLVGDDKLHPEVAKLLREADIGDGATRAGLTRFQALLKAFAYEEAALICDRIANGFAASSESSRGAAMCAEAIRAEAATVSKSVRKGNS